MKPLSEISVRADYPALAFLLEYLLLKAFAARETNHDTPLGMH